MEEEAAPTAAPPFHRAPEDHRNRSAGESEPSIRGGWSASIFIIGMEAAERFASVGISANLIMFLTTLLHMRTASAAKSLYVLEGVSMLFPLVGAFVADSYFGRYRTILYSTVIYVLGLAILTVSVAEIHHPYGKSFFFISLYMVAVGQGGHKPSVQSFGADQFDENSPQERQAKNSFFNWCLFCLCFGAAASVLLIVYIQENVGWAIGFGISAAAMAFALVLFLLGRKSYRRKAPIGSPFTHVAQVLVSASHKLNLHSIEENQEEGWPSLIVDVSLDARPLLRTNQLEFPDKATIIEEVDVARMTKNGWSLCSTTQIEELKLFLRLIPLWLSCLMYAVVFVQPGIFFTKQCSTVDRRLFSSFVLPPASLLVTLTLSGMVSVLIYDRVFVPVARTLTGIPSGLSMLQRIGVGMYLSVICMVVAALVEMRRLRIVRELGLADLPDAIVPMSMGWLLPQYLICGVSMVFTLVGLQEIFYDQMPEGMRSTGSAVCQSIFGVAGLLSSVIVSIVEGVGSEWLADNLNRAHLDYYYLLLAALSFLWLGFFTVVAKSFVHRKKDDVLP